jgi:hypothetical protein
LDKFRRAAVLGFNGAFQLAYLNFNHKFGLTAFLYQRDIDYCTKGPLTTNR